MKASSPWRSNTMLLCSDKKSAFLPLLSNRLLFLTRGPTTVLPSPCSQQWTPIGRRALTSRTPLPAWVSEKRRLATHSLATRRHFLTPPPPFFSPFRFAHWRQKIRGRGFGAPASDRAEGAATHRFRVAAEAAGLV